MKVNSNEKAGTTGEGAPSEREGDNWYLADISIEDAPRIIFDEYRVTPRPKMRKEVRDAEKVGGS